METAKLRRSSESSQPRRPEVRTQGLRRKILSPSAQDRFFNWKKVLLKAPPPETGHVNPKSPQDFASTENRRQSFDVARVSVSRQDVKSVVETTETAYAVSSLGLANGQSLGTLSMNALPGTSFHDAEEGFCKEQIETCFVKPVAHGSDNTTVDVYKLQKDLKRAAVETAEALNCSKKLEDINGQLKQELNALRQNCQRGSQHPHNDSTGMDAQGKNDHLVQHLLKEKKDLETANSGLLAQVAHVQRVNQERQQQNSDLRGEKATVMQQLQELQARYTGIESDLIGLNQELDKLSDQAVRAKKEANDSANERDHARRELNRVVQQLASERAVPDPYYFDDPYFQRQFSYLRGIIKDWANRSFSTCLSKNRRLSAPIIRKFESISKHWDIYMKSNNHRPSFVQAFVWNHLQEVFGGKFWESSVSGQSYGRIQECHSSRDMLPERQRLFHEWRYAGARFAAPKGTESQVITTIGPPRITRAVKAIWETLENWSTMTKTQSCDMLEKIITDAIRLDLEMQQQKTYFRMLGIRDIATEDGNYASYNPETMEVRFGKASNTRSIVLLITPMLLKTGNSEGQDYKTQVIIEKAQVDMEIPKIKKSLF